MFRILANVVGGVNNLCDTKYVTQAYILVKKVVPCTSLRGNESIQHYGPYSRKYLNVFKAKLCLNRASKRIYFLRDSQKIV